MTSSEIDEDVAFLKQKVDDIHPNPYWNLPKSELDSLLTNIRTNLLVEKRVAAKRFYQELNLVISELQDGHTRALPPQSLMLRAFLWGSSLMPVAIRIQGENFYLIADLRRKKLYDEELLIQSINGIPTSEIVQVLLQNYYEFNREFRVNQLSERSLTRELWLYLDLNKQFYVEAIRPSGEVVKFDFRGISQPRYYRRLARFIESIGNRNESLKVIESQNGSYFELPDKSIALITYSYFGGNDEDFFNAVFNRVKSHKVENLVLDLRGNRGGSTNGYKSIISHLTNDTVTMFANVEYMVSRELLDNKTFGQEFEYPGYDAIGEIRYLDNAILRISTAEISEVFEGNFYVLMDGGTFSTASGFCALIKDNNLGTLIGEPTGGLGSSFGNFVRVQLPNSKIPLEISTSRYYRPNGCTSFSPVKPSQHHEAHFILNALHQFIPSH